MNRKQFKVNSKKDLQVNSELKNTILFQLAQCNKKEVEQKIDLLIEDILMLFQIVSVIKIGINIDVAIEDVDEKYED